MKKKSQGMGDVPLPLGYEMVEAHRNQIEFVDKLTGEIWERLIKGKRIYRREIEDFLNECFRAGWSTGASVTKFRTGKFITEQRKKGNIKTKEEFENEYKELLNSLLNTSRELQVSHKKVVSLRRAKNIVIYRPGKLAETVSDEDVWRVLPDCKMQTGRINFTKLGNFFGVSRHTAKTLLRNKKIKG